MEKILFDNIGVISTEVLSGKFGVFWNKKIKEAGIYTLTEKGHEVFEKQQKLRIMINV